MYIPAHFAASADDVRDLLTSHTAADLVTSTDAGLLASTLPLIFDPAGRRTRRTARPRRPQQPAVVSAGRWARRWSILRGPEAYITPSWYAAKARHGRVVPTWNYTVAHVYGRAGDPRRPGLGRRLMSAASPHRHEAAEAHPWSVDDAPDRFVRGQLRAIVGLELRISRVEAKLKLSQNRADDDIEGVVAGLRDRGDHRSADAVLGARRERKA